MDWLIAGLGNPGLNTNVHGTISVGSSSTRSPIGKTTKPGKECGSKRKSKSRRDTVLLIKADNVHECVRRIIKKLINIHKLNAERVFMQYVDEYNFPVGKVHIKIRRFGRRTSMASHVHHRRACYHEFPGVCAAEAIGKRISHTGGWMNMFCLNFASYEIGRKNSTPMITEEHAEAA